MPTRSDLAGRKTSQSEPRWQHRRSLNEEELSSHQTLLVGSKTACNDRPPRMPRRNSNWSGNAKVSVPLDSGGSIFNNTCNTLFLRRFTFVSNPFSLLWRLHENEFMLLSVSKNLHQVLETIISNCAFYIDRFIELDMICICIFSPAPFSNLTSITRCFFMCSKPYGFESSYHSHLLCRALPPCSRLWHLPSFVWTLPPMPKILLPKIHSVRTASVLSQLTPLLSFWTPHIYRTYYHHHITFMAQQQRRLSSASALFMLRIYRLALCIQ